MCSNEYDVTSQLSLESAVVQYAADTSVSSAHTSCDILCTAVQLLK